MKFKSHFSLDDQHVINLDTAHPASPYRMLSLKLPLPDVLDWPPSASAADVRFHVWKSRKTWLNRSIQSSLSCLVSAENQHLNRNIYQYTRITGTLNFSEVLKLFVQPV